MGEKPSQLNNVSNTYKSNSDKIKLPNWKKYGYF